MKKIILIFLILSLGSLGAMAAENSRGVEVWQAAVPQQTRYALPNLWVLAVGVSRYQKQGQNLQYADADAKAMADILKTQEGKLFGQVREKVLVNEQATRGGIMEAFNFLNQAGPQDVVFIFVAGHGVEHKVTKSYYFLPYAANPDNLLYEGLRWADFQEGVSVLRGNVSKVILALDTCHAGAMQVAWRGGDTADLASQIKSAEGLYTLAASKAGEDSVEDVRCKHGAFTCAMLDAFREGDYSRDGVLMVSELFQYVSTKVPQLSNGNQHPYQTVSGTDMPIAMVGEAGAQHVAPRTETPKAAEPARSEIPEKPVTRKSILLIADGKGSGILEMILSKRLNAAGFNVQDLKSGKKGDLGLLIRTEHKSSQDNRGIKSWWVHSTLILHRVSNREEIFSVDKTGIIFGLDIEGAIRGDRAEQFTRKIAQPLADEFMERLGKNKPVN